MTTSPTGTVRRNLAVLGGPTFPDWSRCRSPLHADAAGLEVDIRHLEAEQLSYPET